MKSDLKIRTKDYALSVIWLFAELPKKTETQIMGRQLLRCGTSVGAKTLEARGRHHLRSFRLFENSRNVEVPLRIFISETA
ncbi:MAG TPA: four helix bundle protein [Candidatus Binatia bacterium]|jgi:four helix bundle protein